MQIWSKWQRFVGATKYVDLSMQVKKPSFERKLRWLGYFCAQAMKMADIAGGQEGFNYLAEIIRDVELSEKNKKILAQHLAESHDILSENGRLIASKTGEIIY